MNKLLVVIFTVLLVVTVACTGAGGYTGYKEIPDTGWPYGDDCDYAVSTGDSVATGRLLLSITHDNSYEYSNLWVEVTYDDADNVHHVDTVNVAMCDALGNWYGKGLPGHYQFTDTLTRHAVALADSSVVKVRHIMRVDTLTGISQIGIRFII